MNQILHTTTAHRRNQLLFRAAITIGLLLGGFNRLARADDDGPDASDVLKSTLRTLLDLAQPDEGDSAQTISAHATITRADGLSKALVGLEGDIALQSPDRVYFSGKIHGLSIEAARVGNVIWVYVPDKKFGVIGESGVPLFASDPSDVDQTQLPIVQLPMSKFKLRLLAPLLVSAQLNGVRKLAGEDCDVLNLTASPRLAKLVGLQVGDIELWVRRADHLPIRVRYMDGNLDVQLDLTDVKVNGAWADAKWQMPSKHGDVVAHVAMSHLLRFVADAPRLMERGDLPTLGAATGQRRTVATSGLGRLEMIDDTRVLFLKGTPAQMGQQEGTLLRDQCRDLVERIVYGVGVGGSFERGQWLLGKIDTAETHLLPFVDRRYLDEIDAMADAAGVSRRDARLANFFPELFHCSGFALMGKATADHQLYHGRVLDYLRGVGLEQNAVVVVYQPDVGHAWVNVGYAGFAGSVTAMNDQGISIGELGGQPLEKWDGTPMAELVRTVMEKASTLDEAVKILRDARRTCDYYYVICDGKTKSAIAIEATPDHFQTLQPGMAEPRLPQAIPDALLLSAGDRYRTLVDRVKADYGKFDADVSMRLMKPPVSMDSNIQSALFEPATLDFWVANADATHVASETRFTHYNLGEMLKETR